MRDWQPLTIFFNLLFIIIDVLSGAGRFYYDAILANLFLLSNWKVKQTAILLQKRVTSPSLFTPTLLKLYSSSSK
jgi:hypothetical protein